MLKLNSSRMRFMATFVGVAVTIAACTSHNKKAQESSENFLLGSVDGKEVLVNDLSDADKNMLYKTQKQFYDSTQNLLAQYYFNQFLENYRTKNKFDSLEDAKKDFYEKNAQVENAEVDKFLADNASSPQLQQIPADKRFDIVKNYLSQMAQSKATQNVIQTALNEGKIKVQMAKPTPPLITFKTEGYSYVENAKAPVTLVEFADYQCPYCVMAESEIKKVLEHYNKDGQIKVQFVYYDFPLSFHDQALPASVAAYCASKQGKFWNMHDKLFARDPKDQITSDTLVANAKALDLDMNAFTTCQNDEKSKEFVNAQMAEGMRVGVNGTPAIFINGVRFEQQTTFTNLKAEIDPLL